MQFGVSDPIIVSTSNMPQVQHVIVTKNVEYVEVSDTPINTVCLLSAVE